MQWHGGRRLHVVRRRHVLLLLMMMMMMMMMMMPNELCACSARSFGSSIEPRHVPLVFAHKLLGHSTGKFCAVQTIAGHPKG